MFILVRGFSASPSKNEVWALNSKTMVVHGTRGDVCNWTGSEKRMFFVIRNILFTFCLSISLKFKAHSPCLHLEHKAGQLWRIGCKLNWRTRSLGSNNSCAMAI